MTDNSESLDIFQIAQEHIEKVPEHELRRLVQRIGATDPRVVIRAIEGMVHFDHVRHSMREGTATRDE